MFKNGLIKIIKESNGDLSKPDCFWRINRRPVTPPGVRSVTPGSGTRALSVFLLLLDPILLHFHDDAESRFTILIQKPKNHKLGAGLRAKGQIRGSLMPAGIFPVPVKVSPLEVDASIEGG